MWVHFSPAPIFLNDSILPSFPLFNQDSWWRLFNIANYIARALFKQKVKSTDFQVAIEILIRNLITVNDYRFSRFFFADQNLFYLHSFGGKILDFLSALTHWIMRKIIRNTSKTFPANIFSMLNVLRSFKKNSSRFFQSIELIWWTYRRNIAGRAREKNHKNPPELTKYFFALKNIWKWLDGKIANLKKYTLPRSPVENRYVVGNFAPAATLASHNSVENRCLLSNSAIGITLWKTFLFFIFFCCFSDSRFFFVFLLCPFAGWRIYCCWPILFFSCVEQRAGIFVPLLYFMIEREKCFTFCSREPSQSYTFIHKHKFTRFSDEKWKTSLH